MELLLSRDEIAMSEFELLQLTFRWCQKNNATLMDFLHLFDTNVLTPEEKAWSLQLSAKPKANWTLAQLEANKKAFSLVFNGLYRSDLIDISELRQFKLDYPGLRWKRIYNSSRDRLAVFLETVTRSLELFHRKLIVLRVDERLTLAIYIPQKIEQRHESQVDDRVRLFAFTHSQGDEKKYRMSLSTKKNYRLYCDDNVFQLFENTRGNSWVYIVRGASNDASYRHEETRGKRRKGRQATLDDGINHDCRASIALDKFSRGVANAYRSR